MGECVYKAHVARFTLASLLKTREDEGTKCMWHVSMVLRGSTLKTIWGLLDGSFVFRASDSSIAVELL